MLKKYSVVAITLFFTLLGCLKSDLVASSSERKKEDPSIDVKFDFSNDFKGYKISYGPKIYNEETIFDYINGGADVYLKKGFKSVMTFELESMKDSSQKYVIDIYDMGEAKGAQSIFEKESSNKVQEINGTKVGIGQNQLKMWKLKYYVKVTAYGKPKVSAMKALAGIVDENIE